MIIKTKKYLYSLTLYFSIQKYDRNFKIDSFFSTSDLAIYAVFTITIITVCKENEISGLQVLFSSIDVFPNRLYCLKVKRENHWNHSEKLAKSNKWVNYIFSLCISEFTSIWIRLISFLPLIRCPFAISAFPGNVGAIMRCH